LSFILQPYSFQITYLLAQLVLPVIVNQDSLTRDICRTSRLRWRPQIRECLGKLRLFELTGQFTPVNQLVVSHIADWSVCGLDNSPGVAFKWSNYLLKSFCQHLCEFTSPGVVVQSMMSNTCIDQSTTW